MAAVCSNKKFCARADWGLAESKLLHKGSIVKRVALVLLILSGIVPFARADIIVEPGGIVNIEQNHFEDTITINGGSATLTAGNHFFNPITIYGGTATLTAGNQFKDTITIYGGDATLRGGTFNKSLTVSGGAATLDGGTFNDTVIISGGSATLKNWGNYNKSLTVSGGNATLDSGNFNETVMISGGTATLNNWSTYNKSLTVSGGSATLNSGNFNDTVTISGGTVALNGGNFNGTIVSGGSAYLNGGNFNQSLTVSGGLLEANGEVSINSGIYATGGEIILVDLEKLAGEISLYGDSVLRMYDTVDNFTISLLTVDGTAKAYLDGEYTFSSGTQFSECESGYYKILSTSGSIFGANNSSINYSVSGNGAIYVGQIPEPAAVCFICVAGLGFLIARRLFARFAESGEAELATSTWPLTGDQLRMFVSEDFSAEESSEWDRVEWNRRECGWALRITNQIPMPRLQFADVPPVVEPPQVPEEPVPLVDPALIALPDRPKVRSIPFHLESFLLHAARNQHRPWDLSLCAE